MSYASPANEHWYVAAQNGRRHALLLGPYPNHSTAAKHVTRARLACQRLFPGDKRKGRLLCQLQQVLISTLLPVRS